MGDQNFFDFMKPILESANFNWFATLGYDPDKWSVDEDRAKWERVWELTDPAETSWRRTPEGPRNGSECFRWWRESRGIGGGERDCIWLEEPQAFGNIRFHILVADWIERNDETIQDWKQFSRGWGYQRNLDDRIAGFLGHMVMRAGCVLGVDCLDHAGRYTSEDFIPWRPKD